MYVEWILHMLYSIHEKVTINIIRFRVKEKEMKKKIVALFMVSLMSVMMVTGCGSKEKQEADNTTAAATETVTDSKTATATDDKSGAAATTDTTKDATATDAVEGETVDVGGDYPVSTKYAEYQLLDYYFAETDETLKMVISRTTDGAEYDVHFTFFGEEQDLQFTVKDNAPTVTFDKTGFITKDIVNVYAAIQESDNWTAIQK